MLTVGSLFTGIGGFDFGLEQAGMRVLWQCESDPARRAVLRRQWSGIPVFEDIRHMGFVTTDPVDLVCGGFPCQDISRVGRRAGIDGAQSGLWAEFHRVIRFLRPRYVLVENSTSLCARGLDRIVGDLASIGYDTEWDCLPAAAFGAPHIRDRIYILAYPRGGRHGTPETTVFAGWTSSQLHAGWNPEPRLGRVVDGLPSKVDKSRLRALGNAVVPQVAEWIGRRILTDALREQR